MARLRVIVPVGATLICLALLLGCPQFLGVQQGLPKFTDSWPVYFYDPVGGRPRQVWPDAMAITQDADFVIAGRTAVGGWPLAPGVTRTFLMKTDDLGQRVWWKHLSRQAGPMAAWQAASGLLNVIFVEGEAKDVIVVVSLNDDGDEVDAHEIALSANNVHAQPANDGGILAWARISDSDAYFAKITDVGEQLWATTLSGNAQTRRWFNAVGETTAGYVVVGTVETLDNPKAAETELFLTKTDAAGNEVWTVTHVVDFVGSPSCVQGTADGGCVVAGTATDENYTRFDSFLMKLDADGNLMWLRQFDNPLGGWNVVVRVAPDGDYYLARGSYVTYVKRIGSDGDLVWERFLDAPLNFHLMEPIPEGGCVVVGDYSSDAFATQDGGIVVGDSLGPQPASPMFIVRFDADGQVPE